MMAAQRDGGDIVAATQQMAGEQACPSRNVIALDDSLLIIHKSTAVNNFTET